MTELRRALANHFRIPELHPSDKMPVLVRTRKLGRNVGRLALARAMNDLGVRDGIEIGTNTGQSALEWCKAIPGLHLTCVDPYVTYNTNVQQGDMEQRYKQAREAIRDSGYDINLLRMSSREAVSHFEDGAADFLYIDGDHTFDAVVMDLIQYASKVRKGGIIALHDYLRIPEGGVMEAVDGYTRNHVIVPWYVTYDPAPTAFWQRGSEQR